MTDKMREEFEKWAAGKYFPLERESDGDYIDRDTDLAWTGWQAARTVPDGFVMVPVELLQLIQCDVENAADWLSSATSALRNLLSAAPEGKK